MRRVSLIEGKVYRLLVIRLGYCKCFSASADWFKLRVSPLPHNYVFNLSCMSGHLNPAFPILPFETLFYIRALIFFNIDLRGMKPVLSQN